MSADPAKTLKKFHALMDRALHPSTPIDEARTAALVALRILKDANLAIVPAAEVDELSELRKASRTSSENESSPRRPQRPPWHQRNRTRARIEVEPTPLVYLVLTSMYRGYCRACRREYLPGDEVAYRKGFGATHYKCRSYWDELAEKGKEA